MIRNITAILITLLVSSCSSQDDSKLLSYTEVVLMPGMSVIASNANGSIKITAGEETKRTFEAGEWKKETNLIPRKQRWYGSLGLYDPAPSNVPYGRLLVDEGRLHFSSINEALRYLYVGSTFYKPVYTNDGLVFGFDVKRMGNNEPTRSVKLWQIYINGKKPKIITGAKDNSIKIIGGETPKTSEPYPAPVGYEMILGEIEYNPNKSPNKAIKTDD